MNKSTKNPQENTNATRIRFAIFPIKKHLARFLMLDWEKISSLILQDEIEEYFQKEGQARKLGLPRLPLLMHDEGMREKIIIPFLKYDADGFFNEEPMFKDASEVKIQYYTNRRNLKNEFVPFLEKGYTLVKLSVPVRKINKYEKKQFAKSRNFSSMVKNANEFLDIYFIDYVKQKIKFAQNIDFAIAEIYSILKLTPEDIRVSTIKRAYHRHKNDQRSTRDLFERDHIHKKIWDKKLFEIYQEHVEMNVSYAILSLKYKLSKSTIARICNNQKVIDLYKKIIRLHNSYMDWFLNRN